MAQREVLQFAKQTADNPPEAIGLYSSRLIEGVSVEDTAEILGIRSKAVRPGYIGSASSWTGRSVLH
jgi:RNA polymerase sigma-70 factor, ECF subfamily